MADKIIQLNDSSNNLLFPRTYWRAILDAPAVASPESVAAKQDKLTSLNAGAGISITTDGQGNVIITALNTNDYTALTNKPSINNVTITGALSLAQLGIVSVDNTNNGAFEIADPDGRVIFRITDAGHVVTRAFNSANIPVYLSQLVNDYGYTTAIDIQRILQDYLTAADLSTYIVAGSNITITNNNNILTISSTGGSGGSSNYNDLLNKPQINGTTLQGNVTLNGANLMYDATNTLNDQIDAIAGNIAITNNSIATSGDGNAITSLAISSGQLVAYRDTSFASQSALNTLSVTVAGKADTSWVASNYAPINSPTFTGTVTLPTSTKIGSLTTTGIVTYSNGTLGVSTADYLINPMNNVGDMIYGGAEGVPLALSAGNPGQILIFSDNYTPAWSSWNTAGFLKTNSLGEVSVDTSSYMTSPMTTKGDIIYASDNNGTPARLARGNMGSLLVMDGSGTAIPGDDIPKWLAHPGVDGKVLTSAVGSNGTTVYWATPTGMSNPMTTEGDIIIGGTNGTPTRLGVGTNGQILKLSNGTPQWGANIPEKTQGIFYAQVDSTSTSTNFTVTIPELTATEYYDGLTLLLYNGKVTSASGFTINVNGLGAKPSYSNMALGNPVTPTDPTRDTTIFNINYAMLFTYNSTRVSGGCWICYRGYDANTNTIGYQVRTNNSTLKASDKFYRYRLLFTSADGTKWVPANTSTSTNATSARNVNQRPIDPFGEITWYGTTTAIEANANVTAAQLWQQYYGTYTLIGYSFNNTGAAATMTANRPIYIKCTPQSNGSAIIDANTPYVQALPSTDDGKIYIFLGRAVSATAFEILLNHPVYYHKDGAIRVWTNPADSGMANPMTSLGDMIYGDAGADPIKLSIGTSGQVLTSDGSIPYWATPATPATVGTLDTTATTAQTTSAFESFSNNITLHKVSKTGSYNDLNDKPTIPVDTNTTYTLNVNGTGDNANKVGLVAGGSGSGTVWYTIPYATSANTANSATTAGSATTASTADVANSVAWANVSGHADGVKTDIGISSSGSTYLKKDGTWDTPTDTNTTYALSGALSSHKFTSTLTAGGSGSGTSTSDFTLAAGSNITLTDDTSNRKITIAATDTNTTYSLTVSGTGDNANKLGLTAGGSGSGTTWVTIPYATTSGSANSVSWSNISGHAAGVKADIGMTTLGDIIHGDAGGNPMRLGIGTAGQVLISDGYVPTWGSVSASAVSSGSATSGQMLTADGSGNTSWTTPFTGYTSSNKLSTDYINNVAGWTSNAGTVTSVGITNGGGLSVSGSPITSSGSITLSHADTSSQASVSNSGRTYIQSVTLDDYGHVTALSSATETVTDTNTTYTLNVSGTGDNANKVGLVAGGSGSGTTWYTIPYATSAESAEKDSDGNVIKDTYLKSVSTVKNDLTLLKEGSSPGDSYSLIFQRGTLTDSYNDWRIQDRGGFLYFDQRGSGSSSWSNQAYINTSGTLYATTFSGSGASLTSLNASNISSGTINVARLPSITSDKVSDFTTAARSALSGTSPILYSSSTGAIGIESTGASSGQVLTADGSGGVSWATPASGGMANPMTTAGDIIYGGSSGTPTRLGVGTNGQVLSSNGSAPTWTSLPADTNQTVKTSGVTFSSDDAVEFVGSNNITVTGDASAKTITIGGSDVFVATYDTTTYAEVYNAYSTGKICIVKHPVNPYIHILDQVLDESHVMRFSYHDTATASYISIAPTDYWSMSTEVIQGTAIKSGTSGAYNPAGYVLTANGSGDATWTDPSIVYNVISGITDTAGSSTSGSVLSVKWSVANVAGITTPYDGMKILVRIPRTGVSTGGVLLSIDNGTTYHPVAYNVSTVLTTHYPVNSNKIFVYNATQTMTGYETAGTATTYTGVWQGESDYNSDTLITRGTKAYRFRPYASAAVYKYKIVAFDTNRKLVPIVTNDNTTNPIAAVTSLTPTTASFRPDKFFYYNSSTTVSSGSRVADDTLISIGYNDTNVALCNFNSGLTASRLIYLVGLYNTTTGLFKLRTGNNYVLQANLNGSATFSSGYDYIVLGATGGSNNQFYLREDHPMFHYDGTNLLPYDTWRLNNYTVEGENILSNDQTITPVSTGKVLTANGTGGASWETVSVSASSISGTVPLSKGGTGIAANESNADWYTSTDLHPHFEVAISNLIPVCYYYGPTTGISDVSTALSSEYVQYALKQLVPVYVSGVLAFNGVIIPNTLSGHPEKLQILFPDIVDFMGNLVNGIDGTLYWDGTDLGLTSINMHNPGALTYSGDIVSTGIGGSQIGGPGVPIYWTGSAFAAAGGRMLQYNSTSSRFDSTLTMSNTYSGNDLTGNIVTLGTVPAYGIYTFPTDYIYLKYPYGGSEPLVGLINVTKINNYIYQLTGSGSCSVTNKYVCLTGDTLVTMADGSTKRLDMIELGEEILSFDWDTMKLIPNKVVYTDKDEHKAWIEYDIWTFDDGTKIKTVHRHEFYNVEAKRFKYMDEWVLGEHTYKIDGTTPKLINHERVREGVAHYKISGEHGTNYFANGLLTGDRYCPKSINLG